MASVQFNQWGSIYTPYYYMVCTFSDSASTSLPAVSLIHHPSSGLEIFDNGVLSSVKLCSGFAVSANASTTRLHRPAKPVLHGFCFVGIDLHPLRQYGMLLKLAAIFGFIWIRRLQFYKFFRCCSKFFP